MFCPKCGTQNPENGKFCRHCGTDLSPVSDALAGKPNDQTPDFWKVSRRDRRDFQTWNKKKMPVSWEVAMSKLFTGLAFLAISIVLGFTQMGRDWWFWMLIPAFSIIGGAVAQIIQLKKLPNNSPVLQTETPTNIDAGTNYTLPSSQTDYVKTHVSIYDTGELVAPPSVAEGTTRHLEMKPDFQSTASTENEANDDWRNGKFGR